MCTGFCTLVFMDRIPPRRYGRPPLNIDWVKLRDLVKRGASIRQVKDAMRLSHGSAQNAVKRIRQEIAESSYDWDS